MTEYTHTSDSGLRYYEVIDNDTGDIHRYYESGTIYNESTSKLVKSGKPFNSLTGKAANERRTALKVEAMEEAIRGEGDGDLELGLEALARQRVVVAMGEGHESNKAFELVMKHGKFDIEEEKAAVQINISKSAAIEMLALIAEAKKDLPEVDTPTHDVSFSQGRTYGEIVEKD